MRIAPLLFVASLACLPSTSDAATYTVNPTRVYSERHGCQRAADAQERERGAAAAAGEGAALGPDRHRRDAAGGHRRPHGVSDAADACSRARSARSGWPRRRLRRHREDVPPLRRGAASRLTGSGRGLGCANPDAYGHPGLPPTQPAHATATLREVGMSRARSTFKLANTGNSHFIPDSVTVRGLHRIGSARRGVASRRLVHPGRRRARVRAVAGAPDVRAVRSLLVEVKVGETMLKDAAHDPRRRVPAP